MLRSSLIKFKPMVIYRFEAGTYDDYGRWVKDDTATPVDINANVQPVKYHEIIQMPEADRTSKWCKLFSKEPIRTKKEGENGYDADRFYWQDDQYEIRQTKDWTDSPLPHYVSMCVRVALAPDDGEVDVT